MLISCLTRNIQNVYVIISFLLVDMLSYHSFKQSHLIQKKINFFTAYLQIHGNIIQQISQCTSHWFYGELDSI